MLAGIAQLVERNLAKVYQDKLPKIPSIDTGQ